MKLASCLCVSVMTVCLLPAANIATVRHLPNETGMYARAQGGGWQPIEPETVNRETGGLLKSAFTFYIIRPDINGRIREKSAVIDAGFQDQFLVVVPDGVSIDAFQMVRLHSHAESREFRLVTGGAFFQSGRVNRDVQGFTHTRIAPHTYLVSFERYDGGGEYGFLPSPTVGQMPVYMGKIYCFRMRN